MTNCPQLYKRRLHGTHPKLMYSTTLPCHTGREDGHGSQVIMMYLHEKPHSSGRGDHPCRAAAPLPLGRYRAPLPASRGPGGAPAPGRSACPPTSARAAARRAPAGAAARCRGPRPSRRAVQSHEAEMTTRPNRTTSKQKNSLGRGASLVRASGLERPQLSQTLLKAYQSVAKT